MADVIKNKLKERTTLDEELSDNPSGSDTPSQRKLKDKDILNNLKDTGVNQDPAITQQFVREKRDLIRNGRNKSAAIKSQLKQPRGENQQTGQIGNTAIQPYQPTQSVQPIQSVNPVQVQPYQPTTVTSQDALLAMGIGESTSGDLTRLNQTLVLFNKGQKELKVIKKIDDSQVYRVWHYVKTLGGTKKAKARITQVFRSQNDNVRQMNMILASMIARFGKDAADISGTLDGLIYNGAQTIKARDAYRSKLAPTLESYNQATSLLSNLDRDKEPDKYYSHLKTVIDLKRNLRKLGYVVRDSEATDKHNQRDLQNLYLQEDLFSTLLYGAMEMAKTTERYQQTLDNNLKVWEATIPLADAVRAVSQGLTGLVGLNNDLNGHYVRAITGMQNIFASNPGANALDSTNVQLQQLVEGINTQRYLASGQD
ncbi:hypothetical protein HOK51_02060 [Candidatus Woesearchaeota archaeon]|nr:hypothetical protein [Candidatus Woesearchaeota archaeon]MBT6518600.1 hypothetical protein [Candidatus Woesearchaeota archaeon]MBT7368760.1 hypothetical protein [Candidatus Woesearchaeota archaeon]